MVLIVILIIASFLRLHNLADPVNPLPSGLYPDEAMNGNNALEALETKNWKVFYPENNGREGLFINIQSLFVAAFGNEPWVLRFPSVIFGILTVLGVYLLTKEIFRDLPKKEIGFRLSSPEKLALFSAFLMATSFWHINFSRIGFRAIMAPLLLSWGIYLLLRAFRKPSWHAPIIAGIVYGLGFHTYIAYRATPLLIVICLWLLSRRYGWEPVLRIGFIFTVAAFLVFLPLGLYFIENPADFLGRTAQVSVFSSPTPLKDLGLNVLKTAGMFNFSGDGNWRHNVAGRPLLFWPVGVFFLVGLFFSIYQIIRNQKLKIRNWELVILLTWLAVAALPIVISNEGLPHALRAILMAPPIFIFSAIGGLKIYNFLKRVFPNFKYWVWIRALWFLTLIIFDAYFAYFITWGRNPNVPGAFSADYVAIGRTLNALPKELPKYVIVEAGGVLVRGIPMPSQTVMFITDSFTPKKQKAKNLNYLLPEQIGLIPANQEKYVTYIK